MELKEQLEALEKTYPEGLNWDVHYLAGLVNYSDVFRRQEIGSTIRWWENNLKHGCSKQEEVNAILAELKNMVDSKN
jgi:hypothetical protein